MALAPEKLKIDSLDSSPKPDAAMAVWLCGRWHQNKGQPGGQARHQEGRIRAEDITHAAMKLTKLVAA